MRIPRDEGLRHQQESRLDPMSSMRRDCLVGPSARPCCLMNLVD